MTGSLGGIGVGFTEYMHLGDNVTSVRCRYRHDRCSNSTWSCNSHRSSQTYPRWRRSRKVFFCREILQYIALLFHFHGHFLHYSQHHIQNDDHFSFFPSPLPSNNLKSHSVFLFNPNLFRPLSRYSSGLNRRLRHKELVRSFQGENREGTCRKWMMNEYDKRLNSCFNDGEIKTNFLGVCPWKRNV